MSIIGRKFCLWRRKCHRSIRVLGIANHIVKGRQTYYKFKDILIILLNSIEAENVRNIYYQRPPPGSSFQVGEVKEQQKLIQSPLLSVILGAEKWNTHVSCRRKIK